MAKLSATSLSVFNYNGSNPFSRLQDEDILSNTESRIRVFDRVTGVEFSFFGSDLEPYFDPPQGTITRITNVRGLSVTGFTSPLVDWYDVFVGLKQFNSLMAKIQVGADQLTGSTRNDTLYGYDGNDNINGGSGNDNLNGGGGNDRITGEEGNDTIVGSTGNDNLSGGLGRDSLNGGPGQDLSQYQSSITGVSVSLLTGRGYTGEANGDVLIGIENIYGSAFEDNLSGSNGSNNLVGLNGADILIGNNGNDVLVGGSNGDRLIGGQGQDRFEYRSLRESLLTDIDRIVDLEIGNDRINFPTSIPSNNIENLGSVRSLSATNISQILSGSFLARQGATFRLGGRIYLAVNDNRNNFQASTDCVIEITGFNGSLANLEVV